MGRISEIALLDTVDSTNAYALRNFESFGNGSLIVAKSQTQGRGRKGRSWSSPPDVNVYASLVLKGFGFLPAQASWIGSLAALECLREEAPRLPLKVKWPNDVLCGGAKIAGVLCETKAGPDGGMVIGVGVNLNMTREALAELGRPATSLLVETGRAVADVEGFALKLGKEAMRLFKLARTGGVAELHSMWSAETGLAGSRVEALLDDGSSFQGTVELVGLDGSLSIRRADGRLTQVASGEVSLKGV